MQRKKTIIYEKDYWKDYIKDTLYAKQRMKGDKINWKFRKLGRLGNFYISKKLCDCP
ncbi:hypothetical protein RCZ15_22270 [Capnocytophaga catalasegens]|uniref:Uncharacterized protein n=1 Tax=Capnocytophaga catalasegens TaxID=1004260 RepID=A0AAV5AV54_9FLAO|nr:hypothetical protein RCZ03_20400 [Capnocytophaga catalasegens]GJM51254.1 hypothetical protein RCZ15_22270 [Capnocytophaga catalasegens]GJM53336.1 hypothetical protein RCZ16_16530 [Capnocytophaga catalasegens]